MFVWPVDKPELSSWLGKVPGIIKENLTGLDMEPMQY